MIDVVIVGGWEKTVRPMALCGLNPSGIPQIISLDATGKLSGSTGARSVSALAPEAILIGGKAKSVDVGIGVGQKSDGSLAVTNVDGNGNLK